MTVVPSADLCPVVTGDPLWEGSGTSHTLSEHPGEGTGTCSPLSDPSRAESEPVFCFLGSLDH